MTRWFEQLSAAGRLAAAFGAVIACGALVTLATSLAGGESGSDSPSVSTRQSAGPQLLRGGCTLARSDGALEQVTLTGRPVSERFCRSFASYLEETVGVEEQTWTPHAPAKPLSQQSCSSCSVRPACEVSVSDTSSPGQPVLFLAEAEEAYDELHYYSVYTHYICELLRDRVEVQRFIAHNETG
jgi:hypothetical protein